MHQTEPLLHSPFPGPYPSSSCGSGYRAPHMYQGQSYLNTVAPQASLMRVPTPMHDASITVMPHSPVKQGTCLDVKDMPSAGMESTLQRFPTVIPPGLPVGVVCSPFAKDVVMVDVKEDAIERCRTCHAYANAFVNFSTNDQAWACPFCNSRNAPGHYVNSSLPQYTEGAVGFSYKQEGKKSVRKPSCVFLLDSSAQAIANGALAHAVRAIRNALDELEKSTPDLLISVVTFDADVYFFDIRTRSPKMVAVSSQCEEPFSPENAHLMPLSDAREGLVAVLDYLSTLNAAGAPVGNCMLNALKCTASFMEHGGNLMVFSSAYPTCGAGIEGRQVHERKPSEDFQPANQHFHEFSLLASTNKISVNAFVVSEKDCDLPTMWPLTSVGGRFRHYAHDLESLIAFEADLLKEITSPRVYESVLSIRCSAGWDVDKLYGPLRVTEKGLAIMGALSRDATLSFTLKRCDTKDERTSINARKMFIQICTAYTDTAGERNLRVQTQCFELNPDVGSVHVGPMLAIVAHKAMVLAQDENSIEAGKRYLHTIAGAAHGEHLRPARGPAGEEWSLFLYYLFGLLRSPAFSVAKMDARLRSWAKLATIPCASVIGISTPSLWSVQSIVESSDSPLRLSASSLDSTCSYLMFTGMEWLLWNGKGSVPCDVSAERMTSSGHSVLQFIAKTHGTWCADRGPLYTIAHGSEQTNPWEHVFFASLLEDTGLTLETKQSYSDWRLKLKNRMTCASLR